MNANESNINKAGFTGLAGLLANGQILAKVNSEEPLNEDELYYLQSCSELVIDGFAQISHVLTRLSHLPDTVEEHEINEAAHEMALLVADVLPMLSYWKGAAR